MDFEEIVGDGMILAVITIGLYYLVPKLLYAIKMIGAGIIILLGLPVIIIYSIINNNKKKAIRRRMMIKHHLQK
jgi:hypothetical protein